jgi:hypothetical protein
VPRAGRGELVESRLQFFAPAADHHQLGRVPELEERMDQRLHGTYPEAPGGHQDRGPIRREVVIGAYSALVLRDREYGVDRDPRDGDRDRRDAEPLQVGARLVEGHEVALDVAGEPHSWTSKSVTTIACRVLRRPFDLSCRLRLGCGWLHGRDWERARQPTGDTSALILSRILKSDGADREGSGQGRRLGVAGERPDTPTGA